MREEPTIRTAFVGSSQLFVAVVMLAMLIPAGYLLMMPASEGSKSAEELRRLSENRKLWKSLQVADIEYVVTRGGSMKQEHIYIPYSARESQGFRTAVYKEPISVAGIGALSAPLDPVWIDNIFDTLESSIHSGAQLQVKYHPEYGFPTEFRSWGPCSDCDNAMSIRDFKVLNEVQGGN